MAELILRSGKRAGKRIPIGASECVIGRDDGCHIRLTSTDVSRRHCLLRVEANSIVAADLGSRNGTHVNDALIKGPTVLRPGDRLRVGPFLFQVPGGSEPGVPEAEIGGWLTEDGSPASARPATATNDTTLVNQPGKDGDTTELQVSTARVAPAPAAEEKEEAEADPIVQQAQAAIREYWAARKR